MGSRSGFPLEDREDALEGIGSSKGHRFGQSFVFGQSVMQLVDIRSNIELILVFEAPLRAAFRMDSDSPIFEMPF